MSIAKKVLEEIRRGVAPEILAQRVPWEKLNDQDLVELIKLTREQPDIPESYNLLDYLFRVSREKDLWFSVEVLSNAVQYQKMSLDDRSSILVSMRKRLDQIKDKIAAELPTEVNLRRYWIFEAAYYAVNGATLRETNHLIESVQNYQIARGIFEQLGLFQQADKYTDIIHKMNGGTTGRLGRNSINFIPPQVQPQVIELEKEPEKKEEAAPTALEPAPPASAPAGQLPAFTPVESQPLAFRRQTAPLAPPEKKNGGASSPAQAPLETRLVGEAFAPLPDVWVEEKPEPMPEPKEVENDETRRLADLIQQQNDILSETQLQVQMYLSRRTLLAREVQNLEKKVAFLKQKLERLEKKEKIVEEKATGLD